MISFTCYKRSPLILRANCMSSGRIVIRLAWMAHNCVSSKSCTRNASADCCKASKLTIESEYPSCSPKQFLWPISWMAFLAAAIPSTFDIFGSHAKIACQGAICEAFWRRREAWNAIVEPFATPASLLGRFRLCWAAWQLACTWPLEWDWESCAKLCWPKVRPKKGGPNNDLAVTDIHTRVHTVLRHEPVFYRASIGTVWILARRFASTSRYLTTVDKLLAQFCEKNACTYWSISRCSCLHQRARNCTYALASNWRQTNWTYHNLNLAGKCRLSSSDDDCVCAWKLCFQIQFADFNSCRTFGAQNNCTPPQRLNSCPMCRTCSNVEHVALLDDAMRFRIRCLLASCSDLALIWTTNM